MNEPESPELPPMITGPSAIALGYEWDVEATDLMSSADVAGLIGVRRDTFDSMVTPSRRARYRQVAGLPGSILPGIYQTARVMLWHDPTWRPTAGATGRLWVTHGVIVLPTADDLITLEQLAARLGVTRSNVRSGLTLARRGKTPRSLVNLPDELVPGAKRSVWSVRLVDAAHIGIDEDAVAV